MKDSCQMTIPEDIAAEEEVARIIFSPSMIMDGKVAPSAFFMDELKSGPESYVSVWRSNYRIPSPENIFFKARKQDDKLAGYATIGVSKCHAISYENYNTQIKPHPSNANPAHAGIHFNKGRNAIKGQCYEPGYLMLATMIAGNCSLVTF